MTSNHACGSVIPVEQAVQVEPLSVERKTPPPFVEA
jgi:hypothetical protein